MDSSPSRLTWLGCGVIGFFLSIPTPPAEAQGGNLGNFGTLGGVTPTGRYPSDQYYRALEVYRSGDLELAVDQFDAAMRQTRRDIHGRWVDAIPVLAMQAECYWHLGNIVAVRENVDHVFQIAIRNRGWLSRVDWNSAVSPNVQLAQQTGLWPDAASISRFPVADQIMFGSGNIVTPNTLLQGGAIQEPNLRSMDIVEIMRGLAIASYRRRIVLGPLAEQDPLASQLLDATKYPAGLAMPIGKSLIGSMRTVEHFSYHDDLQTIAGASQSTTLNGSVHPLSPIATLALASALAGSKQPSDAVAVAAQVANSAAALRQPEWVGEAMQLAAGCVASPEQAESVRQAATTAATALNRNSRLASLHCLVAAADASISAGNVDSAALLLGQAQSLSARRDVRQPRIDAYGGYVAARLAAARGESVGVGVVTDVDKSLSLMTAFSLNRRDRNRPIISMPRIYQFALVQQAAGTMLGGKSSDQLLQAYSDDPPVDLWRRDAVDALSSVMIDHSQAHIARVNLAASQGYAEEVLKKSDAMLAARFYERLPLGGRIAQVRNLARSDESFLNQEAIDFRKNAGRMMSDLRQAVMAMAEPNPIAAQKLEAAACSVALSRVHLPRNLPPPLDEKLPVAKLPPRTGLLTFVAAGNNTFATLSGDGKTVMWTIGGSSRLPGEVGRILRGIGVGKQRGNRLPEDDSWRKDAVALRQHLFPDDSTITADRFDELVIVPDGPLWYLPFELLPIEGEDSPLITDVMRIRYAATPGLALHPVAMPPSSRKIGVVADLFFAPRDPDRNEAITQSILDVCDDPVRLPDDVDTPTGLLGNSIGHLVVAAPRAANPANPLAMSVAPYDGTNAAGTVAGWMRFPAEVPRSVVLAGFRTPVGTGQMGTGDEIFMTLCGLNAAGVRSVLLSRWAVGGESTATALREFVQELPFAGMLASWQRATMVLRRSELDPATEPLMTKADHEYEGLTGDEPLFWAGYLVSAPDQKSVDR